MTDTDERLLTVAKLREALRGDLDHGDTAYSHAGLVEDSDHRSTLSFVARAVDGPVRDSDLGAALLDTWTTDAATEAVFDGNASVASHLVGVTEQELSGENLRLPLQLLDQLHNNGAPAFPVAAGNPNTGKTNTMLLLVELFKADIDDLLLVSNFESSLTDRRVTSAHDLAVTLLEERDVPKFVVIDEASTHFDARTYSHEVATQWTPLAKRFAKIGVEAAGLIVHTGKDLHPEGKRMATLPFFKSEKQVATFYERWPADADMPCDTLFGGDLDSLEPTSARYDPDDAAPWAWDLEQELFTEDLGWDELLTELRKRGPDS